MYRSCSLQFLLFFLPPALVGWHYHLFGYPDFYLGILGYWVVIGFHLLMVQSYFTTQRLFGWTFKAMRIGLRLAAILSLIGCSYTIVFGGLRMMRDNEVPLDYLLAFIVVTPFSALEFRPVRRFIVRTTYRTYRPILWLSQWFI